MLEKEMKVGYQNREGSRHDLQAVPQIILANKHLEYISGIKISDHVTVCYEPDRIIIKKSNLK